MKITMYNTLGVLIAILLTLTTVYFWLEVTLLSENQMLHVALSYAALNLLTYLARNLIAGLIKREKSNQKFKFVKPLGDSNESD